MDISILHLSDLHISEKSGTFSQILYNLLDILNYMDIGDFIFKLVFNYVDLFKIDLKKFVEEINFLTEGNICNI